MKTTLYEIADRYHQALELLYDDEIPEDVALDTLESIEGEMEMKAETYAAIIGNLESLAKDIREAEKKQAERRKALENKASRLRSRLLDSMVTNGVPKFETAMFRISVRQNPESVVIDDESLIPADYLREIPARHEPDKGLMKQALKDGFVIPGAHIERGNRLEIK